MTLQEPVTEVPRLKVLLHVGVPKTGTSAAQHILFANRETLAAQGILYPAQRFDEHFLAALDLMELPWGGLEKQAAGAWGRLADEVRAWDGHTAIISHEILATASRAQVSRALESFDDAEIHIVLSARDLVRQIPAEWQENVKHRRVVGYKDFLDEIRDPARTGRLASWFWGVQEIPDILDRWGSTLPPEQVHLVTVPGPDAPRDLLWQRFAAVFGVDPGLRAEDERSNPSLGVPESALIRRVNQRLNDGQLANHHYRAFVRELLAHRTLSRRTSTGRLALPADAREWAVQLSGRWVESLAERAYDVVGSLEELQPGPDPRPFVDPDHPDEAEVSSAAVDAIVALLQEAVRLRDVEDDLRHELEVTRHERDTAMGPVKRRVHRAKQGFVRSADDNAAARMALGAYRRVRGRSSRSA